MATGMMTPEQRAQWAEDQRLKADPKVVRVLVQDRWDQLMVTPEPDSGRGSGITSSPINDQLEEILRMIGALLAGGEVVQFGMADVVDELEETIHARLCEWAIAYTLGERTGDAAQTEESAA